MKIKIKSLLILIFSLSLLTACASVENRSDDDFPQGKDGKTTSSSSYYAKHGKKDKEPIPIVTIMQQLKNINKVDAVVSEEADQTVGDVREKLMVPNAIKVLSPHGGKTWSINVYDAENMLPYEASTFLDAKRVEYLTSGKNLKVVYVANSYEPIKIDKHGNDNKIDIAVSVVNERVFYIHDQHGVQRFDNGLNIPIFIKGGNIIVIIKKVGAGL